MSDEAVEREVWRRLWEPCRLRRSARLAHEPCPLDYVVAMGHCLGIDAVEPKFQAMKPKLESIKNLNDAYAGKQLLFFSLEGSTASHGPSAHGAPLDMSSSLLEAIVKMLNAPSAYERLPLGALVRHPIRGAGKIIDILPDRRRVVKFDLNFFDFCVALDAEADSDELLERLGQVHWVLHQEARVEDCHLEQ